MLSVETQSPQEIARSLYGADSASESTTSLSTDATEQVIALLVDNCVEEQRQRDKRWLTRSLAWYAGSFFLMWLAFLGHAAFYKNHLPGHPWIESFPALLNALLLQLMNRQEPASKTQQAAVVALAEIAPSDPRTIAALIDILPRLPVAMFAHYQTGWNESYGKTLPRITAPLWNAGEDLSLILTESRRDRLRGTLRALWNQETNFTNAQGDFCAAAIRALAKVGDTKSVSLLEKIINGKQPGPNRDFLRNLAKDCLVILHERANETKAVGATLSHLLKRTQGTFDGATLKSWMSTNDSAMAQNSLRGYLKRVAQTQTIGKISSEALNAIGFGVIWLLGYQAIKTNAFGEIWKLVLASFFARPLLKLPGTIARRGMPPTEAIAVCMESVGDVRLLPELLDLAPFSNSLFYGVIATWLRRLQPGDQIYFASRHLAYLRRFVSQKIPSRFSEIKSTDGLSSVIYALGALGDVKATKLLTGILENPSLIDTRVREEALNALRKINDIREWRESYTTKKVTTRV